MIAKRLCAFRLMPVKAKCAEGNTDDKLSPSSVMYSTQLACKHKKISFCYNNQTIKDILSIHNTFMNSENIYLHKAPGKEQPAKET